MRMILILAVLSLTTAAKAEPCVYGDNRRPSIPWTATSRRAVPSSRAPSGR